MGAGAIAAIATAAIAAASAGYSMSGAGTPSEPNLTAASKQQADIEAQLLPYIRGLEAAAQEGGTALNEGYTKTTYGADQIQQLQQQINQQQKLVNSLQARTGKDSTRAGPGYVAQQQQKLQQLKGALQAIPQGGGTVYLNSKGQPVPASQALANFEGQSQADIQGQITEQLAQGELANAQRFDPQYIAEALAQEAQANPQGVEARNALYQEIQNQITTPPPISPVSTEMQRQIGERVAAGSGLTPEENDLLNNAMASAAGARGSSPDGPAYTGDLTTGFAGEQRALGNAQAGGAWLQSGQSPQDIEYRRLQQDLSNLGAFESGQTPEAQFKSLSNAQAGPTPYTTGGATPLTTVGGNPGQTGIAGALNQYEAQVNQPNPWMTGLSALIGGGRVANNLGAFG